MEMLTGRFDRVIARRRECDGDGVYDDYYDDNDSGSRRTFQIMGCPGMP
ncbi:MAG: hypothetical protein FWC23_05035 [Chitinispirillia bacterium]|nr:hypothetical protein [Chitinispirillia bacterium]MCL2268532.1 hypothetical protein [Chitinispirillia bacterium]